MIVFFLRDFEGAVRLRSSFELFLWKKAEPQFRLAHQFAILTVKTSALGVFLTDLASVVEDERRSGGGEIYGDGG